MEHEGGDDSNCKWHARNNPQRVRRLGNKRTRGDHLDYRINKIGQNTEKSPGELRRLAVAQNPQENHQLTFVRKNHLKNNDNNNNNNNGIQHIKTC